MTPDQINDFFSFLYDGRLGEALFWLRLVAGVVTSALAAAIMVIVVKFRQLNMSYSPEPLPEAALPDKELAAKPWDDVLKKIGSLNPSDWNLAVIQADAIFDAVTKDMGVPGETLGERLRNLDSAKLASLDDVWEAHKIRNRIAHEAERVITYEEAARAVSLFGKALRELAYLQE